MSDTDGLTPTYMYLLQDPTVQSDFTFDWLAGGVRQAVYRFRAYQSAFDTSQPAQQLVADTVQGPAQMGDVPERADQAVLMTQFPAPPTWGVSTVPVTLILDGYLTFKWMVTFQEPVMEFRLDGTWTRVS